MKKSILALLLVSIVSQSFSWSWSAPLHAIGSSASSIYSKKSLVTAAVGFIAGSCVTVGIIWLASKLQRKKKEEENVSNWDLFCAVHFLTQQLQEFRDGPRLNIASANSDE